MHSINPFKNMSFHFHYLLFLLLLCVSPHACSSRHLGLLNKEAKYELRLNGKDFSMQDKVLEKTSIVPKQRRQSVFEEIHLAGFEGKKSAEDFDSENTMKQYDINLEERKMDKGNGHKMSSSGEVFQETTKIKGRKTRARSTMESKNQNDDNDENIKSKENDIVEDVVVMDYAQPHRKPPIHNLEP